MHFVTEELTAGPVVLQAALQVKPGDDIESLTQRVHVAEHQIYPLAMRWFAEGRLRLAEQGAMLTASPCRSPAIRSKSRRYHASRLAACSRRAGPSGQALELKPFSASYTADWKQVPVSGTAQRSLEQLDDGSWRLDFDASMLVASLNERSTFRTEGDTFLPQSYRLKRSGLGKGKRVEHRFDWDNKVVEGSDRGEPVKLPLHVGLLDKSTYQVALQHEVAAGKKSMSYQVVDGDEIETYDFRVLGQEKVSTKAGQVDAIKVERVRDPTQSKRETILWFAKDWDYLLVRLHQVEKDGKEYQIMLEEGSVGGKTVKGN